MPFTPAHPAIIIPIYNRFKNYFSLTGLVLGCIIPDFEFFLALHTTNNYGHHFPGIIFLDIPLAFLFCFIYHLIIKDVVFQYLPIRLQQKLIPFLKINWILYFKNNWFKILYSIVLGIFTHIFWDAFTHYYGVFVKVIPFLSLKIFKMPIYTLLQIISSIIGVIYVTIKIYQLPSINSNDIKINKFPFYLFLKITTICLFILRCVLIKNYTKWDDYVVAYFGCGLYAIIILCIIYKYKNITEQLQCP